MSLTRVLACATGTALATAAVLLACGPFLTDFRSVQTIAPAHPETFARGSGPTTSRSRCGRSGSRAYASAKTSSASAQREA